MADEWISPTGFNDPGTQWSTETYAYDNNLDESAACNVTQLKDWSNFLELTHAALDCSKVRYYIHADTEADITQVDVDVYYGDDWHHVYEGAFTEGEWIEKELGGIYSVTAVRFSFYNNHDTWNRWARLAEVDFWWAATAAAGRSFGFIFG